MAMITLKGLWLHLADDLLQYVHFPILRSATMTPAKSVAHIELAGGRTVTRTRPATRRRYVATVRVFDNAPAIAAQVEAWLGETVMIRDSRGHKLFGVIAEAPMVELEDRPGFDLTLTVDSVSASEAV